MSARVPGTERCWALDAVIAIAALGSFRAVMAIAAPDARVAGRLPGLVARHGYGARALFTWRTHAWPDSLAAKVLSRQVTPPCVGLRGGASAREPENRADHPPAQAALPRSHVSFRRGPA